MVLQVTTFWDGIVLNTLQASSMLPHFAYMSTELFPTMTSDSQQLMKRPTTFKCSRTSTCIVTWTKGNLSRLIPSHCGCWKSWIAFSGCLSFTYFVSFLFHAKMLNCTVPGAIAAISAATHGGNHQSSFLSTSCVILCLRSRYLSFAGNQKSRSGMYSLHPTRQCYHSKNRESRTDLPSQSARDFCHNILHLLTFSSLLLPTHQCKLSNKNFCHELWPNKTPLRWREGSYR